jgi:hypothetical protein
MPQKGCPKKTNRHKGRQRGNLKKFLKVSIVCMKEKIHKDEMQPLPPGITPVPPTIPAAVLATKLP